MVCILETERERERDRDKKKVAQTDQSSSMSNEERSYIHIVDIYSIRNEIRFGNTHRNVYTREKFIYLLKSLMPKRHWVNIT